MAINLIDYECRARDAIRMFWRERESARQRQTAAGRSDQGERAGVTAGKNMDGFIDLICDLVKANGLDSADIHQRRAVLTLPGFFRPTKLWDLLIVRDGVLIAAIELKSQVGPSFGNNFNNRAEEAIGTAHDFWTAYREGAFGQCRPPFVGWLMLVEDALGSRSQVRDQSPHFPVLPEFRNASYLQRYDLLCRKLVQEKLYTAAALLASPRDGGETGAYTNLSPMTGLKEFVAGLAGHIAISASK